jgi:protein-L-isoaspartate(D-aspartate) O-methyltransferase
MTEVVEFEAARERMVRDQIEARGVCAPRVLAAMRRVPRHRFVGSTLRERAYDDGPLPIGECQTISQPYMVAVMVEALELTGDERVLEIGTGSGYEAAVLAELCAEVYSIERLPRLAARAQRVLESLGYRGVHVRVGDGSCGWPEAAPFGAIVMSAGGPRIPRPLVEQLAEGGRLVLPMGDEDGQTLVRVRKVAGGLREECLGECRFVKLIGAYGWEEPSRGH